MCRNAATRLASAHCCIGGDDVQYLRCRRRRSRRYPRPTARLYFTVQRRRSSRCVIQSMSGTGPRRRTLMRLTRPFGRRDRHTLNPRATNPWVAKQAGSRWDGACAGSMRAAAAKPCCLLSADLATNMSRACWPCIVAYVHSCAAAKRCGRAGCGSQSGRTSRQYCYSNNQWLERCEGPLCPHPVSRRDRTALFTTPQWCITCALRCDLVRGHSQPSAAQLPNVPGGEVLPPRRQRIRCPCLNITSPSA
jgi:hypothetical protein